MLVLDNTVCEHVLDGYKYQFLSMPRGVSKQAILEASIKNDSNLYTVKASVLYKKRMVFFIFISLCFFLMLNGYLTYFFFTNLLYSTWFTVQEWQAQY